MEPAEPPRYKVIILGNVGVGKTSIASRQCRLPFRQEVRPSVGVLKLKTRAQVSDSVVHLEVWDTAGQEKYLALVPIYARDASVCIVLAAMNDPESIPGMNQWIGQVKTHDPAIPIIIGINKTDLADGPEAIEQVRTSLAGVGDVFFCSAQSGDGIEELFNTAAEKCISCHRPVIQASVEPIEPTQESAGGCC
jgi:small GTP-binding protein